MIIDAFEHIHNGKGRIQIDHYSDHWHATVAVFAGPMVIKSAPLAEDALRLALVESDRLLRDGTRVRQSDERQLDIEDAIAAVSDDFDGLLG